MQGLPLTDINLPAEILVLVCPYLCKKDQLRAKLVSRKLHYAATIQAFRSIRLKPDGDTPSQFREIAMSEALRGFVKEVIVDTEPDPEVRHDSISRFHVCENLLQFLPYLGFFNNLTHLHLRFARSSDAQGFFVYMGWYFRYLVLDITAHCVTRRWTPANRAKIYETKPPVGKDKFEYTPDAPVVRGNLLQIKELTISHLADFNDRRLIRSQAWYKLLRLPTLTDLKLLVGEDHMRYGTLLSARKYAFFSALPSQWLTPKVAQKLQVLSLFYTDYWGPYPKVDLDQIGALPFLKVLALGRYVFTDKKETDWIASLGKNNKSGGLEELYLDECCVLFQAKQYVNLAAVLDTDPGPYAAIETTMYSRRWYHVLSEWTVTMQGLKKFVMGVGEWSCPFRTKETWDNEIDPVTEAMVRDPPDWYFGHNRHRFFAHPEPENFERGFLAAYHSRSEKSKAVPMGNYLLGEGLRQKRRAQMQYAWYNVRVPGQWCIGNQFGIYSDDIGCWAPERVTPDLDDAAYALLMETIRNRPRS